MRWYRHWAYKQRTAYLLLCGILMGVCLSFMIDSVRAEEWAWAGLRFLGVLILCYQIIDIRIINYRELMRDSRA